MINTIKTGRLPALALLVSALLSPWHAGAQSGTGSPDLLADQPFGDSNVPGNLAFLFSNEYPTFEDDANWVSYVDTTNFGGYFDSQKCYVYQFNWTQPGQSYFRPVTHGGGPNKHFCDPASLAATGVAASNFPSPSGSSGLWSGNLLNWATMQTIDPIRSALTGGFRVVDRSGPGDPMPDGSTGTDPATGKPYPLTILEKAWNDKYFSTTPSSQIRGTWLVHSWWHAYSTQYLLPQNLVGNLTPFGNWMSGWWYRNPTNNDHSYAAIIPVGATKNPGGVALTTAQKNNAQAQKIPGGFFTFIKGLGTRMVISPVDPTLWYPVDTPTLWAPGGTGVTDARTGRDIQQQASDNLTILDIGWDNTAIGQSYYNAGNFDTSNGPLNDPDYIHYILPPASGVWTLPTTSATAQPPSATYRTTTGTSYGVGGVAFPAAPAATGGVTEPGSVTVSAADFAGLFTTNTTGTTEPRTQYTKTNSSGTNGIAGANSAGRLSRSCSTRNNPYPCYQLYVRVSVCDNSLGLDGKSLLEDNCVDYPLGSNSPTIYKPEGLFQKYASQLRYSIFSYPYAYQSKSLPQALMGSSMSFIGQTKPNSDPTQPFTDNSARAEWDPTTGVMLHNPDSSATNKTIPTAVANLKNQWSAVDWTSKMISDNLYYATTDAGTSGLSAATYNKNPTAGSVQSGVMNLLNKAGQNGGYREDKPYRVIDYTDDLYYAALRYYMTSSAAGGNPWGSSMPGTGTSGSTSYNTAYNGFSAVKTWTDPILYRCQRNFILGISDDHTWEYASNNAYLDSLGGIPKLGGTTNDTVVNWTKKVGTMEGINPWNATATSKYGGRPGAAPSLAFPQWDGEKTMGTTGGYMMAGMAYYLHTNDIRPDLPALGKTNGKVTVDTYWVDVSEFNAIEHESPAILAAKYGGFAVPSTFNPATQTTDLPQAWWNTTGDMMRTHVRGDPTAFSNTPMADGTTVDDGSIPSDGSGSQSSSGANSGGNYVACTSTNNADAYSSANTLVSCWQTQNNGRYPRPDNFFTAVSSANMVASLQNAFANMVASMTQFSTAFALSSSTVGAGGIGSYSAEYSPGGWTGTVFGSTLTMTGASDIGLPSVWNTNGVLPTQFATKPASTYDDGFFTYPVNAYQGWDTQRRVITSNGNPHSGTPFRWNNLTGAQQAAFNNLTYAGKTIILPGGGADYVNYLRGDKTNEVGSSVPGGANVLRQRTQMLGDIVDSSLLVVGPPQMPLTDQTNPGYAAFKTGPAASRPTMVYFGANDGMVHAINGDLSGATVTFFSQTITPPDPVADPSDPYTITLSATVGGTEAFAYVPTAMFNSPAVSPVGATSASTSPDNPLAWLGNPNYIHHNMVDATPVAFDVDFDRTNGATPADDASDWHTILIGGLGKGGNSFYALDITDPASMAASENTAADKFLWEFTASDMGYSYGAPTIVKTAQYGWVVALTSGYDNSDGFGHVYLLNPTDGRLLAKISTPTSSHGLTQAAAYIGDYGKYVADALYAGDLDGHLWRFDLTDASSGAPATLLANLTDAGGTAQPVTTAPLVETDPATNRRFVLVGTGRLLDRSDIASTQMQNFYAIVDGTPDTFKTVSTALTPADLTQVTDLTTPPSAISGNGNGWYIDLNNPNTNYIPPGSAIKATTSASGERIVTQTLSAYSGIVSFSTDLMTPDPCIPAVSNAYAIYFGTGKTAIPNDTAYLPQTSRVTNTQVIVTSSGKTEWLIGHADGTVTPYDLNSATSNSMRLVNWRSVPVTGN